MKKTIFIVTIFVFSLLFIGCKPKPGDPNTFLYPIEEDGLFGFIDENGKVVISPQFLSVTTFSEGLSVVVIDTIYKIIEDDSTLSFDEELPKWNPKNTTYLYLKYGYINPQGEYVIKPNLIARYPLEENVQHISYVPSLDGYSFNDGLAVYMDSTNLYGYIDMSNDIVINCQYAFAKEFSEHKAVVQKVNTDNTSDKINCVGLIDERGNPISSFHYLNITNYNKSRAIAVAKTKEMEFTSSGISLPNYSLILLDENGFEVKEWPVGWGWLFIPKEFSDDGVVRFEPRVKAPVLPASMTSWHYLDSYGDFVEPIYKVDENFEIIDPLSQEDIDKLDRLFSTETRLCICPEVYIKDCTPFQEGFAAITVDSVHWFFVDRYFIIRGDRNSDDFTYEGAGTFNNGLAPVKKNGQWGYINDDFIVAIPYKYDQASSFYGALALVSSFNGDTSRAVSSYINRRGEVVWQKISLKKDVVHNTYSKKLPALYGQWFIESPEEGLISHFSYIIGLCVCSAIVLLLCIIYFHKKKKSRLEKEKQLREQEKQKEYIRKIEQERARLVAAEKEKARLEEESERKRVSEAKQNHIDDNLVKTINTLKSEIERDRIISLSNLKSDKSEIVKLLEKEKIDHFYHFTAFENIPLIKKYGGLYSWWSLKQKGIDVPFVGGSGGPSQSLDLQYNLQDYVRLSFCNNHPMQYRHKCNGVRLVLLKIDKEVATWKDTLFSDINATDNNHHCGGSFDDLKKVNFSAVKRSYVSRDDADFKPHQAEILVRTFIPVKYIKNIDNPIDL